MLVIEFDRTGHTIQSAVGVDPLLRFVICQGSLPAGFIHFGQPFLKMIMSELKMDFGDRMIGLTLVEPIPHKSTIVIQRS